MRLRIYLLCCVLAVAALLAGCARQAPVPMEWSPAAARRWIESQQYSVWEGWRSGDKLPPHPDGLCLGNRAVFAAVGTDGRDLTTITALDSGKPSRRTTPPIAPLRWSLRRGTVGRHPLAELPRQRLRRVRGAAIAVGMVANDSIEITTVDFAPVSTMNPASSVQDLPAIVRLVIVRNRSRYPMDDLWLDLAQPGLHRASKWGRAIVDVDDGRLLVVADRHLYIREQRRPVIAADLGNLAPGEISGAAYYLMAWPGRAPKGARERALAALRQHAREPLALAEQSARVWRSWSRLPKPIAESARSNERTRDLIDGLLCLIKTRLTPAGLRGGPAMGWHADTPLREYFYAQRALSAAGRRGDAVFLLDRALRVARNLDTETIYHSADGERARVVSARAADLCYPALMARFAQRAGLIDGGHYYARIAACLDRVDVADSGQQPFVGDEPWLRAMDMNPLALSLENTCLAAAAMEYGAYLAKTTGRADDAQRYAEIAVRTRAAIERDFYSRYLRRFVIAIDGGDLADETLAPGVFARAALTGCYPAGDMRIARGLSDAWYRLGYTGGLRAHARTYMIDGGTPGWALWAAAEAGAPFACDLHTRVLRFCSATGSASELRSARDPAWASGRGSLLDSSAVALGLLRHIDASAPSSPWPNPRRPRSSSFQRAATAFLGDGKPNCVIVHDQAPGHARLIANQIARLRGVQTPIKSTAGGLAPIRARGDVIIISEYEPSPYRQRGRNYRVLRRAGHWQVWVLDRANAPADVHGLLSDLANWVKPAAAAPAVHPEALIGRARAIGRRTSGDTARVHIEASEPIEMGVGGRAAGGRAGEFYPRLGPQANSKRQTSARSPQVSVALRAQGALCTVRVRAESEAPVRVWVVVVLPPAYQVIARGDDRQWNPVAEPALVTRRADGDLRLSLRLRPGMRGRSVREFTLTLAKY